MKPTAKLSLVELASIAATLYTLIGTFGLHGAAWKWVGGMISDAISLRILSKHEYA